MTKFYNKTTRLPTGNKQNWFSPQAICAWGQITTLHIMLCSFNIMNNACFYVMQKYSE